MSNRKTMTAEEFREGGEWLLPKFEEASDRALQFAASMLDTLADSHRQFEVAAGSILFAVASKLPGNLRCIEAANDTVEVYKGDLLIGTVRSVIDIGAVDKLVQTQEIVLSELGAFVMETACSAHAEEAKANLLKKYGITLSDDAPATLSTPDTTEAN